MTRCGRATVALTLMVCAAGARAQDSSAAPTSGPSLPIDVTLVRPFALTYDIAVTTGDSTRVIGRRLVRLDSATLAGTLAWRLVEERSGAVPAADSLFLSYDLRPLQWSATVSRTRLAAAFSRDTMYGATTGPTGKQNIIAEAGPDLLVSAPMVEAVLGTLPLSSSWMDSATVLLLDGATARQVPAEVAVVGEQDLEVDSLIIRTTWVVSVRSDPWQTLYWVDKEAGVVLRTQTRLPPHVGGLLEYVIRTPER